MKKITQTKTPEDFKKISKQELYKLWFGERLWDTPMTDGQIAKMYGVTKQEVKDKRKEKGITWLSCGLTYMSGRGSRKK